MGTADGSHATRRRPACWVRRRCFHERGYPGPGSYDSGKDQKVGQHAPPLPRTPSVSVNLHNSEHADQLNDVVTDILPSSVAYRTQQQGHDVLQDQVPVLRQGALYARTP